MLIPMGTYLLRMIFGTGISPDGIYHPFGGLCPDVTRVLRRRQPPMRGARGVTSGGLAGRAARPPALCAKTG